MAGHLATRSLRATSQTGDEMPIDDRERAQLYREAGWGWWISDDDPFATHVGPPAGADEAPSKVRDFLDWEADVDGARERLASLFRVVRLGAE